MTVSFGWSLRKLKNLLQLERLPDPLRSASGLGPAGEPHQDEEVAEGQKGFGPAVQGIHVG
jgi:hypothetical protein